MLKGQDIVVLLRLLGADREWTVRSIGEPIGLDSGTTHRSLGRLDEARLIRLADRRLVREGVEEFLLHGFIYVFPGRLGGETRGVATAWAAEPLSREVVTGRELPPVWPEPTGASRGLALEPLHPRVPGMARKDRALGEMLVLLDGLRLGDARLRAIAGRELSQRIVNSPKASV